ncbi:LytTR family DNA-binding domain-containing protein [Leptobacterium sp. I13]|uniref:LytR/AlgR family response regulator transcription factor n=1 Tax=Leptobacterium meishanense TaxID=3128904 RepID=UPI0030EE1A4C
MDIKLAYVKKKPTTILWYFLVPFIIVTFVFLIQNISFDLSKASWQAYLKMLLNTLPYAAGALILILFYVNYKKKHQKSSTPIPSKGKIKLVSANGREVLYLQHKDLLFIKSEDNYSCIYYLKNNNIERKLFRGSLSSFEKQLSFPLIRVHRSFIINLMNVFKIKGNSQGYKVEMDLLNMEVPISRKYTANFLTAIEKLEMQIL